MSMLEVAMKKVLHAVVVLVLVALMSVGTLVSKAEAVPITFDFSYSNGLGATASGFVTFESTLLGTMNPSIGQQWISTTLDPVIWWMSLTVSGATSGNGTFFRDDFSALLFDSDFTALDFNQPLIGQATLNGVWGPGGTGDFNFVFATPNAPTMTDFFELTTFGGAGDTLTLTSFTPHAGPAIVPEPSTLLLLGFGLASFGLLRKRAKKAL